LTPRIVVVVPCWARGALEAACLRHHVPLFDAVVVVTSPDDPDTVFAHYHEGSSERVWWVCAPNSPLGSKHNEGMWCALDSALATHLCVVGSDDFLSPRYVQTLRELAADNVEHAALLDCYRIDRRSGKARHEVGPQSDDSERIYGSGRMVSARWLRKCGGWTHEAERHLDADLSDRLAAVGAPRVRGLRMADAGPVCFTTGTVNMWPRWSAHSRPVDADDVRKAVGMPDVVGLG
jgi:hypothetical protein